MTHISTAFTMPSRHPRPARAASPGRPHGGHALESAFVDEQLEQRTVPANRAAVRSAGDLVIYWMQAAHRLDDNWALRLAVREADRLDRPLLVYQGLDPTYKHASDRIHSFILEGARETAARAAALGLAYRFVLRRRRDDDRRVVDRLATRACLIVTDLFPTAGIAERTRRLADRVACHVTQVDASTVVPSGLFATEQYSAAVIRPKLLRVRDHYLQAVHDHSGPTAEPFLDELITWRELAFNFCLRNRHYDRLRCLPPWVQQSLATHTGDAREAHYCRRELEAGTTHDSLWNAAQHELLRSGVMHNAVRTVWGKSVLLWTRTYRAALQTLLHLNNRYGLDGRDPNSFLNILWCFGKFDRPFAERPVWGKVRPMSLERARKKFDAARYVEMWGG